MQSKQHRASCHRSCATHRSRSTLGAAYCSVWPKVLVSLLRAKPGVLVEFLTPGFSIFSAAGSRITRPVADSCVHNQIQNSGRRSAAGASAGAGDGKRRFWKTATDDESGSDSDGSGQPGDANNRTPEPQPKQLKVADFFHRTGNRAAQTRQRKRQRQGQQKHKKKKKR